MDKIKNFFISLWSEPVTNRERVFVVIALVALAIALIF